MDPIEELKKKKILLLSGGWSAEREVSIRSGAAVSAAFESDIACCAPATSPKSN